LRGLFLSGREYDAFRGVGRVSSAEATGAAAKTASKDSERIDGLIVLE
jgi:hypothetical protein